MNRFDSTWNDDSCYRLVHFDTGLVELDLYSRSQN